jgi:sugar/nucleoside kinase (ribokinase family)
VSGPSVVVFGSLTIDNVVRATGEILPQSAGGNAVYAALGARVWSDSVGMVSRRGEGYHEATLELLRREGIDVEGVRRVEGRHRMNVAFAYREDGGRTRHIPPELLDRMDARDRARFFDSSTRADGHLILMDFAPDFDDMPVAWRESVRAIHCPSTPLARQAQIAREARAYVSSRRRWIGVDSPWHDSQKARGKDASVLFPNIDALLPSEQDFENYRPGDRHDDVAADLLRQGLAALVLKRGPNGCRIYRGPAAEPRDIPAIRVDAVDPTGAGDSFCGGLAAGFVLTGDLSMAAHYGTVSASFCVERPGLEGLLGVSRDEASRRLLALSRRTGVAVEPA